MNKSRVVYVCNSCGAEHIKWSGKCSACEAWNSIVEEFVPEKSHQRTYALSSELKSTILAAVQKQTETRFTTGSHELDRVLGGGLVQGSVVLIGGDPGVGKSTLLLQALSTMSQSHSVLYVSAEESLQQIALRASRLNLSMDHLKVAADIQLEAILSIAETEKPRVVVVDSIQTIFTRELQSAPGAVGQVRECAARLVQFAKQTQTVVFIIGHVTKEGNIAGPRVLEHIVDTVLYFEGDRSERFRILRAVKNRFGPMNEIGIFAMMDKGLKEVSNPSAIFLSRAELSTAGSLVMVTWEGTRPLLIEVQALVDESHLMNPKRLAVGLDQNRLAMLLAVLHRHVGVVTYNQDVFVNVVGGVRIVETAIDLPIVLAVISSLKNKPLPLDWVAFGEIGLSGEIRPVQNGMDRLKEAAKHGFKTAIIPKANQQTKLDIEGIKIYGIDHLRDLPDVLEG